MAAEALIVEDAYQRGYADAIADIAACKMDLQDVGVKKLDETDALIIRAITLYCKAEFGYSDKSEQFWKSYECLKTHLSLTKGLTALTEADFTEITQQEVKAMFA